MSKTIKFNLRIDGKPIRNLSDLQENFVIEDLVEIYDEGLLQKWLLVRGYDDKAKKIAAVKRSDDETLIRDLIRIFELPVENSRVDEELYNLRFNKERARVLASSKELENDRNAFINKYHDEYEKLILSIKEDKDNYPFIKRTLDLIQGFYRRLFNVDAFRLYNEFKKEAPLAVFAMLMNESLRIDLEKNIEIGNDFSLLYNDKAILESLGENLIMFAGETDGYWKVVRESGKKYMVVSMLKGNFVGSPKDYTTEFSADEINGHYLILDGIIYKSNNPEHQLLFMEV